MTTILSVLLGVPFALLAVAAWQTTRRARARKQRIAALEDRESQVLSAVRAFVDASRNSSMCVIEALDRALRAEHPSIDTMLTFVPTGEDLACVYSGGDRARHYADLRIYRDGSDYLPARAALAGHRVLAAPGNRVLIPTDRRALAVPMRDETQLRAVVYVSSANADAPWDEETVVRTVEHATAPYAMALEREADRADATYDGLTGLLTPRAFRAKLQADSVRAHFRNHTLTLWFIDTDHFKNVNDTYGHAAGDVVLQRMADLLRAHIVPDVDSGARNGGDEFCAMLDRVQKTVAIERAQAFCDAVRTHDFGVPLRITASVGVATYPYDAQTPSELLEVADAAMYHSKRVGRDRVSFCVERAGFAVYR